MISALLSISALPLSRPHRFVSVMRLLSIEDIVVNSYPFIFPHQLKSLCEELDGISGRVSGPWQIYLLTYKILLLIFFLPFQEHLLLTESQRAKPQYHFSPPRVVVMTKARRHSPYSSHLWVTDSLTSE